MNTDVFNPQDVERLKQAHRYLWWCFLATAINLAAWLVIALTKGNWLGEFALVPYAGALSLATAAWRRASTRSLSFSAAGFMAVNTLIVIGATLLNTGVSPSHTTLVLLTIVAVALGTSRIAAIIDRRRSRRPETPHNELHFVAEIRFENPEEE